MIFHSYEAFALKVGWTFSLGIEYSRVKLHFEEAREGNARRHETFPTASRTCPTVVQIQIELEKRTSSLRELIECCSNNVVLPENALLDNHVDKRTDFLVASANFESLLENPRLSRSQIEKLHRQYDAILEDLRRSRRLLGAELPRSIHLYVTRRVEHL